MSKLRYARDFFEQRYRQMGCAVKSTRAVNDRFGPLFGIVDEVLQRLIGLLIIDKHQHRIGNQSGQWDEIGTGGFRLPPEKLVDLFIAGESVVVRQQRIAIRLCISGNLSANLTSG